MKTLFTLLLTGLTALSAFAADVTGRITVSLNGNKDYQVLIDGRNYYTNNDRIFLNDVRAGQHTIEVLKIRNNNSRNGRNNVKPVYSGSFTVHQQYDMNITIDRNGRVQFNETKSRSNRNDRDWNNKRRDERYNDRYDDRNNNGGWNNNNNYNRAMTDADFSQFAQRIRSQWFGTNKMNAAREGINTNYFTTTQVRQVLQIFASENDRLELAKLAYGKTVDQRSFTQLYDLFSRNAQIELDQYTRDYRY
jgi:hypothetical protein